MNFITFDELLPGIKNWAATVQVIDKQKSQISKKGRRYLKLLLADEKVHKTNDYRFNTHPTNTMYLMLLSIH